MSSLKKFYAVRNTYAVGLAAIFIVFGIVVCILTALDNDSPVTWSSLEANTYYDGRNVSVHTRTSVRRCRNLCRQHKESCKVYVWRGGTCMLKDLVGVRRQVKGAISVRMNFTGTLSASPITRANTSWGHPLPTYTFAYIPQASWTDERNLLTRSVPLHTFGHVQNVGECATLATTVFQTLFTFIPSTLECFVYEYSRDVSAPGIHMLKSNGIIFDTLPANFQTADIVNGTSLRDCLRACDKTFCVGYRLEGSFCKLYAPSIHLNGGLAGWIYQPLIHREASGVQYVNLRGYTLGGLKTVVTKSSIASLDACAVAANGGGHGLFVFNASAQSCSILSLDDSLDSTTYLMNNPTASVAMPQAVFRDGAVMQVMVDKVANASSCAIHPSCQMSLNECFATSFNSTSNECTLLKAKRSFDKNMELGWIRNTSLPLTMKSTKKVAFFVTAHQDDHELFMVQSMLTSLGEVDTKVVFVYITAGDLYTMLKWPLRERSTLVGTQVGVDYHGLYPSKAVYDTTVIEKHNVTRVTMGNAIHYFLRLPESGSSRVMGNRKATITISPVDKVNERYNSYDDVKKVLESLLEQEADGIEGIEFHTSEYQKMNIVYNATVQEDHFLHRGTGEMLASIVAAHPKWQSCAHQQFYFGYQKWMLQPDLPSEVALFQRYMWLREFAGIMDPKNTSSGWDFHAKQLGRMYKSRIYTPTISSCL